MNSTKRCRHGDMTYRTNDLYIGRSFELYGEFSEGEVELFRRVVHAGQIVLDVGANIGAHTVPLAKLVGRTGRVLAFEPQRTVFYTLCGNVAQNNLELVVHCYHAAVGEQPGTIAVPELDPDAEQNFGGLSLAGVTEPAGLSSVPVIRIDDLRLSKCDFIKIDVEGMERAVLVGASETIRRCRPLLYIEDDRREQSPALRRYLASLGYEMFMHNPLLFNPKNFLDNRENVFGNIVSQNLFAHHVETPSPLGNDPAGMQRVIVERSSMPSGGGPMSFPNGSTSPEANANLNHGLALYSQGLFSEAQAAFQQALAIKPDFAEAHNNLGLTRAAQGSLDEAVAAYRRAIALKPDFAEAHHNLGLALRQLGQLEPGLASCREAARLMPELPQVQNSLGSALQELGRHEEAISSLLEAIRLKPDLAQAHNNLGIAYWQLGRFEEAVASYRRAAELAPDMAEAQSNLATVLRDLGEIEEAKSCYDRALAIKPGYSEARWNRSLLSLLQGDFQRGWSEYECRWTLKTFQRRNCPQPIWDGSPLEGKTILLAAEQGLGDTIQFLRYAPLLQRRGARVVAEVHRPLRRLARTCPGVDKVVVLGESPPHFDTYVPLMSLPRVFNTDLQTIPADVPYLSADAALIEQWRKEVAALPGFKVGIAWRGSPQNAMDRSRSIPLAVFESIARLPGITLVSLQKGVGAEQIAEVADRFSVIDFGSRLDETSGPFMDTAALMKTLDLVITCDSALAHLAGALGVRVWIALMRTPDWRWLLDRDDSPWYPTARLFRQPTLGDWPGTFERLASTLSELVVSF
jgi:FkbM family methyltransferase